MVITSEQLLSLGFIGKVNYYRLNINGVTLLTNKSVEWESEGIKVYMES